MSIQSKIILLKNLFCFMETARIGTVSGAAEANSMKQPNLSNCVKDLEQDVKCELFNRNYRGVSLTENGREIFKIACDIDKVLYKIENFSIATHNISGDIRLWTSEGLGTGFLSACLPDFLSQYPDVHIDIVCTLDSPKIIQETDMAVVYDEPKQGDAVIVCKNQLEFGLFASMEYLLKYGHPKNIEDLQNNHRICDRSNFVDVWPEWKEFIENSKHVVTTTNSSSMLVRLTRDGIGIGLHPIAIGKKEKELIHLSDIKLNLSHPFWIVSHQGTKDVPKVRALINYIQEATSQI